jgi:hypothetical protein
MMQLQLHMQVPLRNDKPVSCARLQQAGLLKDRQAAACSV